MAVFLFIEQVKSKNWQTNPGGTIADCPQTVNQTK